MADEALSNELLALAGESDNHIKHSRKRQASGSKSSSSKRRKQEMTTDSDDGDYESEDMANDEYPLEGKFKDEADREYLLGLPEIKREEILAKRVEGIQKEQERRNIERMVKSQASGGGNAMDVDGVAKAAKRKHTGIGSSEKKSKSLDMLKQKRQAKESRRANKTRDSESPVPKRQFSETPSASSDDEEGQVYRPKPDNSSSSIDGPHSKGDEKITVADLMKARITRDMLENQCMSDRFEEYVKGGWVRLLIGNDSDGPVYRLAEVVEVSHETTEPYQLGSKWVNQMLDLRHAGQVRSFLMNKVSCGPFTDREVERVLRGLEAEKIKPPTRTKLEKKGEAIRAVDEKPRTEAEVASMLARQREIRKKPTAAEIVANRADWTTQRTLAMKRNDRAEVERLSALLAELDQDGEVEKKKTEVVDPIARLNERNKRLNLQMQKAAALEAHRRKLAANNGVAAPVDMSARVKTVPKTRFDSRGGTPVPTSPAATTPAPTVAATKAAPVVSVFGRPKVDAIALSVNLDLDL